MLYVTASVGDIKPTNFLIHQHLAEALIQNDKHLHTSKHDHTWSSLQFNCLNITSEKPKTFSFAIINKTRKSDNE